MLCACIDIGSNTTRLLVAETDGTRLRAVDERRVFTRLGSGEDLSAAKVAACCATVAEQVRLARDHGVERLRVVGTAALRAAPDRERLVAAIEAAAGVPVDVLSGDDEAELAFRGATHALTGAPDGEVGVVDVGGGSSEIVVGTVGGGVRWSRSVPVGSAVLAARHLRSDPPSRGELDAVRDDVAAALAGVDAPRPPAAYAVGGSATSLRRIVGPVLDAGALDRAVGLVCERPAAEIAERFGLHVERVRLLPAGMLLLAGAAAALGGIALEVGCGGLREGVLLAELDREGVVR